MSLEQYNVGTNPFLALSKAIKTGNSSSANLGHALILQGVQHAQVMDHLERSHQLAQEGVAAQHAHEVGMQTRNQSFEAGQSAADREHQLKMVGTIHKRAQGGTSVKLGSGSFTAEYTKAARPKKAAPVKAQGPQMVGMPVNIASAAKPAAPATKTPKYAHRDPVTNKITHYEDTPQVLKPAKKTATKSVTKKKK